MSCRERQAVQLQQSLCSSRSWLPSAKSWQDKLSVWHKLLAGLQTDENRQTFQSSYKQCMGQLAELQQVLHICCFPRTAYKTVYICTELYCKVRTRYLLKQILYYQLMQTWSQLQWCYACFLLCCVQVTSCHTRHTVFRFTIALLCCIRVFKPKLILYLEEFA